MSQRKNNHENYKVFYNRMTTKYYVKKNNRNMVTAHRHLHCTGASQGTGARTAEWSPGDQAVDRRRSYSSPAWGYFSNTSHSSQLLLMLLSLSRMPSCIPCKLLLHPHPPGKLLFTHEEPAQMSLSGVIDSAYPWPPKPLFSRTLQLQVIICIHVSPLLAINSRE